MPWEHDDAGSNPAILTKFNAYHSYSSYYVRLQNGTTGVQVLYGMPKRRPKL